MQALFLVLLAVAVPDPEPDASFVGTWELVSLVQEGRPRPGKGVLIVAPGTEGKPARWTWKLLHGAKGEMITARKPGTPWPLTGRHTPSPRVGSYADNGGEGVYRLKGDQLTIAWGRHSAPVAKGDEDVFAPAAGWTVETYRHVRREPDAAFQPSRFPKGPAVLLATWDEASRGCLQGAPRGILSHHALYDLGDGVRLIYQRGSAFLDDPPAPDLEPNDVPTGTIVRPPGGKFDGKTYDIAYPTPDATTKAVMLAFRDRNLPIPAGRSGFDVPKSESSVDRFYGWDGLLLSVRPDGDRTIVDVLFRPRVLSLSCHGNRTLGGIRSPWLETWEYRDGQLRYLQGGPEWGLMDQDAASVWPDPGTTSKAYVAPGTLPRPADLPPAGPSYAFPTIVHYRPARLDLEDATRMATDTPAPAPTTPEFAIRQVFNRVPAMTVPPARDAFFQDVRLRPGNHQSNWQAVIVSVVRQGDGLRAEILVWPAIAASEGKQFRPVSVAPYHETWEYKDGRPRFVSGEAASRWSQRRSLP